MGLAVFGLIFGIGHFLNRKPRRRSQPAPLVYSDARLKADPFDHACPSGEHRTVGAQGSRWRRGALADAKLQKIGEGWVIDRSTGGLGLYCDEPLEVGTEISVRPEEGQHVSPWGQVVVRSHHRIDDHWKLGCQFLRMPPWSVLLLFG